MTEWDIGAITRMLRNRNTEGNHEMRIYANNNIHNVFMPSVHCKELKQRIHSHCSLEFVPSPQKSEISLKVIVKFASMNME